MWIFTETGFVSAVKKPRDNGLVSLRSRDYALLEPFAAKYKVDPGTRFINALHDVWAVMTKTEDLNARTAR